MKSRENKLKNKKKINFFIKFLIFIIVLVIICYVYARYINNNMFEIKEYSISTNKINEDFDGIKLVQFADTHYGFTVFKDELDKMVKKINYVNPDIVVFNGDLIDKSYVKSMDEEDKKIIADAFNNINSKYGKYAIAGNHDYDETVFFEIIKMTDFILLDDSNDIIYGEDNSKIFISGVSSTIKHFINYETLFDGYNNEFYNILLLHEPDSVDEILKENNFDLALAGHTHGGQMRLPFVKTLFTSTGGLKYNEEYHQINDTKLYISFGIGNTNLPFRTFNSPSINFFRINKE